PRKGMRGRHAEMSRHRGDDDLTRPREADRFARRGDHAGDLALVLCAILRLRMAVERHRCDGGPVGGTVRVRGPRLGAQVPGRTRARVPLHAPDAEAPELELATAPDDPEHVTTLV